MNRDDIQAQISKYKSRRLKSRLANYATLVSLFLSLSIFSSGFTQSTFLSFMLFAPVLVYFCLQSNKYISKSRQIKLRLKELNSMTYDRWPTFSLINFLKQPSFAFRLSLVLLFLALFTTFARVKEGAPSANLQSMTYNLPN